jgi:outer membrane lipoprotein-sorting protein
MVRRTLTALVCLAVMLPAGRAAAQTVDELVAKNLQAKGGLAKIQSIQTIKQTGHMVMQGVAGVLTMYGKRPNLVRQEIALGNQTVINAFDGTTAWIVNPLAGSTAPTVLSGPQADVIKEQSDFDGPLVNYRQKGYRIELVGEETLNGRQVYHLTLTDKAGQIQHYYLDAQTGLEARVVSDTEMGKLEQQLSDYREVDGVKMPFSVTTLVNGLPMGQITLDTVQVNVKLDDSMFRMPASR